MSEHADLPPSSSKEWGRCFGWLALNEVTPEPPETDESRWGNECHGYCEGWLSSARRGATVPPANDDQEMVDTARMYVEHCLELMRACDVFGGDALGIESKVDAGCTAGTSDFFLYDAKTHTVYVRDLKTGRLLVEPEDPQIILYAWGVIDRLGLSDLDLMLDIGVVQPRGFHKDGPIRTRRMYAHTLRGDINRLTNAADANRQRNHPATAGPHCRNCNARTRCQAAIAAGPELLAVSAEAVPADPEPHELGTLMRWTAQAIKHLQSMQKAYEGAAEGAIAAGHIVPGYSMQGTFARSDDWNDDTEELEVIALAGLFGVEAVETKLKTPAQLRAAGVPKEVVSGYCTRRKTGVKLVASSPTDIQNIFGDLK